MPDHRDSISRDLQQFTTSPLREASLSLLKTLGYQSDKTIALEGSKPKAFLELLESNNPEITFDQKKALFSEWKSADLLFQLTDEEISRETTLFKDTSVKPGLLSSYLFFAIELTGGDYARGKLTAIARQINRVFPMPVMVLIKHLADGKPVLSIAVINRRRNKVRAEKDVLEKTTIIRDISLADPHRGHKDILDSFAFENLTHPKKQTINSFDALHTAWEEIFNIELLNNRFYKELSNWYFWALPQVEFPADAESDDEKRRATGLIRLLTRLIFCWFIKEKDLIPEKLFQPDDLDKILEGFDPESETSSTYYQAILQNLFFATLNQRMGKDGNSKPYRVFAKDEGFLKNKSTYDVNNPYRYEARVIDVGDYLTVAIPSIVPQP
jgi:adenine-specific DNA-methyltransferase